MLHPLNYRSGSRRWPLRWGIYFAVVAGGFMAIRFGPQVASRARAAYWTHRCRTHVFPADQTVPLEAAGDAGTPLQALRGVGPRASETWKGWGTLVFLHQRRSSGGRERLVIVFVENLRLESGDCQFFYMAIPLDGDTVNQLGPWARMSIVRIPAPVVDNREKLSPWNLHAAAWHHVVDAVRGSPAVTLFAGQVDDDDESAFSFRYRTEGGTAGEVRGQLVDDVSNGIGVYDVDLTFTAVAAPAAAPAAGG